MLFEILLFNCKVKLLREWVLNQLDYYQLCAMLYACPPQGLWRRALCVYQPQSE